MATIKKEIYYLVDHKNKEFFFYDNFIDAREKEAEFKEKYGAKTVTLPNGNTIEDCNPIHYRSKTLKNYYGTLYFLYKWDNENLIFYLEGRKKEIDSIKRIYPKQTNGMKLKKIILQDYQEFLKKHGFIGDDN